MDRIRSSAASAALRPFVRAYAQRYVNTAVEIVQPVVASLEQVLQFDFGDPLWIDYRNGNRGSSHAVSVVGAHSFHRASIRFCGTVESFGVFLQPFGLWQLFGIPNEEILNNAFSGRDVLGNELWQLWMQMAEANTFEKRVVVIEAYLARKACTALPQTPMMALASCMFQNRGVDRIAAVAEASGLCTRQFERRFKADVGVAPKTFARVSRFQMALDAKVRVPDRTWLQISHEFGYHDQMHLLRDFRELSGHAPNGLMAQLGDGRPSALASSGEC